MSCADCTSLRIFSRNHSRDFRTVVAAYVRNRDFLGSKAPWKKRDFEISPSMIAGGVIVNPGAAADRIMQGLGKPESLQPGRVQVTSRRASFSRGSVRYDDGQYY